MIDLNKIKQDHEIATQPAWWGNPDRRKATARLLEQIPALVEELREARAENERLESAVEDANNLTRVCNAMNVEWTHALEELCQARAELRHVQAERDTLQALVPLYRAVDRLLWHPLSNSYPRGYYNRDQLRELWETFRGMSVDATEAEDAQLE